MKGDKYTQHDYHSQLYLCVLFSLGVITVQFLGKHIFHKYKGGLKHIIITYICLYKLHANIKQSSALGKSLLAAFPDIRF